MKEPKIGMRVKRGPYWCWGDQDCFNGKPQNGTIVKFNEGGSLDCFVKWDYNKRTNCYSFSQKQIIEIPEFVQEEFDI